MSPTTDDARIRHMVSKWAEAVRRKDSLGLTEGFAPEVLLFDLIDPLQYVGADALKKRAKEWP